MIRLFKIEYLKLFYSKTFWVIITLYTGLTWPVALIIDKTSKSFTFGDGGEQNGPNLESMGFSVFNFPDIWMNLAYMLSFFKILLAVIIVIHVSNEYAFRTLRQNIIDGMSKIEIIVAKELVIIIMAIFSTLMLLALALVFGKNPNNKSLFDGIEIVFSNFLSVLLYLNFAYLLTTILKKSGLVIGILLLYSFVIENLIAFKLPENIADFLPIHLINNMIPNPMSKLMGNEISTDLSIANIAVSLVYISLFLGSIYLLLKRGNAGKQ